MDKVLDGLKNATAQELQPIVDRPAVFVVTLTPWTCLYIPVGAIVFDDVTEGTLSYYLRVPLLPSTQTNHEAYVHYTALAKTSNRGGTDKMETVCELIKANVPAP